MARFWADGRSSASSTSGSRRESDRVPTKARGSRTTEPHSPRDFVSDGVRIGYQVIDTYLKQGQKAARQFVSASNGGERGPGPSDESDIRAIQLFTELMANWSDLVGMFTETLNSAAGPLRAAERPQEPSPGAAASRGTTRSEQRSASISGVPVRASSTSPSRTSDHEFTARWLRCTVGLP